MSLNHMIDTHIKAKYEPELCEICETNEACTSEYGEAICEECLRERAQDRQENMRDSYD